MLIEWERGHDGRLVRRRIHHDHTQDNLIVRFHRLWEELHTANNADEEWINEWIARVKLLQCDCGKKLTRLLRRHPPRYNDWFAWTVELHNAVNASLGKPSMSVEEAMDRWKNE